MIPMVHVLQSLIYISCFIALPDPIFATDADIIYCGVTIRGGIFKEYDFRGQQVFDVPTVDEINKYSSVNFIIRVQSICCVLQQ
jgi:hypothetical protein